MRRRIWKKPNPDYKQAISDLSKALKLEPKSALMYLLRADAYAKIGNCANARKDFASSVDLESRIMNMPPTSYELLRCLESNDE